MAEALPDAVRRMIDFLGALGSRWGLPDSACRVHGYLYLTARPATTEALSAATGLDSAAIGDALAWLADYRLIERAGPSAWRTSSDPWELMVRALDERRRREIGPAMAVLRDCQAEARRGDPIVARQVGKLLDLARDLEAIEGQARRFSPATLRQAIGLGGLAARAINRTFGRREP